MPVSIDEEINSYLNLLNDRQKEAVLGVVKAFTEEEVEAEEYSDELMEDLDSQYAAYQRGELITYSEEEVKEKIRADRYAGSNK